MIRIPATALAVALLAAAPADAQRVELRGRGDPQLDRQLAALLESGAFELVATTRLVRQADTLRGPVLAVGATIRVDGTILGDLITVGGNAFLRPGAVVTGDVVNIAGGYYPSELADVHGRVIDEPNAPYRVERTEDALIIIGVDRRPRLVLEGLRGLHLPSYDRVDGVTLTAGAALLLVRTAGLDTRVRGQLDYRSQRGAVTGGAELIGDAGRLRVTLGAERTTASNETWVRPRWTNSISYFFVRNDYYDHYQSDRAYLETELTVVREAAPTVLQLRLEYEEAASLAAGRPWTVFRRDRAPRPNRPVDGGRIGSVTLGARSSLAGDWITLTAYGAAEVARASVAGDFDFGRFEAGAEVSLAALLNHTLRVQTRLQGPLPGTDSLPCQRWAMVGGAETLYTEPIGGFHGDRLVWVQTAYSIPFRGVIRLPLLGPPTLELLHVAAMAWTHDETRSLEQNVGGRVRAGVMFVRYMVNPADTRQDEFAVGITLPGAQPWRRRVD